MDLSFFQNSHFYFCTIDPENGTIVDVNRSLANKLGKFRKELVGKSVHTICPECSLSEVKKHLDSKSTYYHQSDVTLDKGQTFSVSWEFHHHNENLLLIGRDVTDLRKNVFYRDRQSKRLNILNTVISEQEGSLKTRIENLLDLALDYLELDLGIVSQVKGDDYIIQYFRPENASLEPKQKFVYKNTYCAILLKEGRSWATNHMGNSKYAQHPCYKQLNLESYIGAQVFVDDKLYGTLNFSSYSVYDKYFMKEEIAFVEMLASLIGIMIEDDIKTQKNKRSFEVLKEMIKSTPAPVAMFDKEVRYLAYSDAWEEEYHISDPNILGKSHYKVFPNISQHWKDIHQRCLKGETLENPEDTFINANGNREWLRWVVKPWYDTNNEIGGIIMLTEVITKRKKVELSLKAEKEKAEAANRAKARFLSNMSHELRTPLNAIIGYSQLIADSIDPENPIRKNSDVIQSSGQHLLSMINDILSLAKIESGQMTAITAMLNIVELLREIKLMFQPKADEKHLSFSLTIDDNVPESITSDESKIRQIAINLIGNAIKFTQEGFVNIETSFIKVAGNMNIVVRVSDSGPGIKKGDTEKIFESFAQSKTYNQEGTGLGLTITKNLVELLDGTIIVRSTPGVGSEFEFSIPVSEYSNLSKVSKPTHSSIKLPERYHALIADDVQINTIVLEEILKKNGFDTTIANNGQEAIDKAKENVFDIVFMDIRMPVKDGVQAYREISKLDSYSNTPIIAVTASDFDEDENENEMIKIGFTDVIIKPFSKHQLLEVINKNLRVEVVPEPQAVPQVDSKRTFIEITQSLKEDQINEIKFIIRNQDFEKLVNYIHTLSNSLPTKHFKQLCSIAEQLDREFDFESLINIGKQL